MRNGSTWPELSLRIAPQRSTDDADDAADDADDAAADDDGGDDDASGAWADAMQVGTGPLLARWRSRSSRQCNVKATQRSKSRAPSNSVRCMTRAVAQQRALHDACRGATACLARHWACLFLPAAQPLLQSASLSPFVPWMRKAMRLVQAAPDVSTHPPRRTSGALPGCDWPKWDWAKREWSKWDCAKRDSGQVGQRLGGIGRVSRGGACYRTTRSQPPVSDRGSPLASAAQCL